jgi:protein-S-isoprenylcysteine O-methyltransferase Ste14
MTTKNEMKWSGVGPRLALTTLPFIMLAIIFMIKEPNFLVMDFLNGLVAKIIGFSWLAIGLVFYIISAKTFFKGFEKGELITYGTYSLCRNPIYASFIIFLIPALALIFKSGIILSIDVAFYVNFKVLIREEYFNLKKIFGEEYDRYEKKVNEIIPIPKFWN